MRKLTFPVLCIALSACMQPCALAPENMSDFKPLMFHNVVREGEEDPYQEGKQRLAEAAACMETLTDAEKCSFALALVHEFDVELTARGLDTRAPDFITDFALAVNSNPEVAQADESMWSDMLNWQGVYGRAIAQLTPELQQKLRHDYMVVLMDSYAAYMIARYAELNNTLPADQRAKARSIVALIASHADGEFGHRDTGLDEIEGYTPQQLDMKRIRPQYQGS